jgi:7-dehydrocholesterol reductase
LKILPQPSLFGFALYFGWLFFQGLLYVILPGKMGYGQRTPAGYLLPYVVRKRFFILLNFLFYKNNFKYAR